MPKRSSKKLKKTPPPAESADQPASPDSQQESGGKNPAAVALGRLGGKKGGFARAAKLTKEKRSEIAKKAAAVRWKKKKT